MVSLNETSLKYWQDNDLEYLRYDYDQAGYCIDVGSYRREWAENIKDKFNCMVECFEALDNRAAWIYDGEIEMGGDFYYTTTYADKRPYKYRCFDLAKLIRRPVDVMKINIEGGEYMLLNHIIDRGKIGYIKNIQVQFHEVSDFDYNTEYHLLADRLIKTHHITWKYPFCWENWKLNEI